MGNRGSARQDTEQEEWRTRMDKKLSWQEAIQSVQPRIRLLRSFDERNHTCLGYGLRVEEVIGDAASSRLLWEKLPMQNTSFELVIRFGARRLNLFCFSGC